jgi:hypothetical protein
LAPGFTSLMVLMASTAISPNPREPEASTPTSSRDIDELTDNLSEIQISDLIGNRKSEFGSDSAPTHDGSELESLFKLHITTIVYREALQSKSLFALQKNLDDLFQLELRPQLAPQHRHAATTSTSRGRSVARTCLKFRVPCTFEFQISVTRYLRPTTSWVFSVDLM